MRALVKERAGPGMSLCDVPIPQYGPHDVLIKVHFAGVCGTDLHIWEWDRWASNRLKPPVTIGHEFSGEIAALGRDAEATGLLAVGHLCRRTQIIGVDRDGAFAEYIAMPASNVMRLDGIPQEVGAIMDPMGNAVHTVLEGGSVVGARVLVLGCGPIGCFAVGVARAAGASLVIASDFNERRLELAKAMGAHVTLNPGHENVVARVRELTGGDGADLVCEFSGHPSGHQQAFEAARLGGRVNMLGTPSRSTEVDFARDVIFKGLTLYGVTGRRMYRTWDEMQRFLRSGQLDPRPVITHRFPMERMEEAIGVIKDGTAGKVILEIAA
jgi:threonine 3-dehydrogenase